MKFALSSVECGMKIKQVQELYEWSLLLVKCVISVFNTNLVR